MAFCETAGSAVVECINFFNKRDDLSVCEFGNQRFSIPEKYFKKHILEKFQNLMSSLYLVIFTLIVLKIFTPILAFLIISLSI